MRLASALSRVATVVPFAKITIIWFCVCHCTIQLQFDGAQLRALLDAGRAWRLQQRPCGREKENRGNGDGGVKHACRTRATVAQNTHCLQSNNADQGRTGGGGTTENVRWADRSTMVARGKGRQVHTWHQRREECRMLSRCLPAVPMSLCAFAAQERRLLPHTLEEKDCTLTASERQQLEAFHCVHWMKQINSSSDPSDRR
jgi:hypothetical protein